MAGLWEPKGQEVIATPSPVLSMYFDQVPGSTGKTADLGILTRKPPMPMLYLQHSLLI